MNIYTHLIFTGFILFLFLGFYVFYLDRKSVINRLLFYMNILFSVWSLGAFLFYYAGSVADCWLWYKVILSGQCFYIPLSVYFFLVLTKNERLLKKWQTHVLLIIPPIIIFFIFILTNNIIVKDFIIISPSHIKILFKFDFWFFFYLFSQIGCSFYILSILIAWYKKLKYPAEKKQALLIFFSSSMIFTLAATVGIVFPIFFNLDTAPLAPVAAIPGTLGLWYAFVKYKILVLTPSLAVESILDTMVESVILVDPDLTIIAVNKETCKLLEYDEKELTGKDLKFLFNDKLFSKGRFSDLIRNGPIRNYEIKYKTKNDRIIPVVFSASAYKDNHNNLLGIVVISRDITERKLAEEQLKHIAHHDFLTGLPNRLLFTDRLKQAISRSHRIGCLTAVFLLDVDGFKEVNDRYGHDSGDELLIEIAGRLRLIIRDTDTVARLGGDEFVLILNDLRSIDGVREIANKIHDSFSEKFIINSQELHITPSIGISICPDNGASEEVLLKNADLAMYHAKKNGKNNYHLYQSSFDIKE